MRLFLMTTSFLLTAAFLTAQVVSWSNTFGGSLYDNSASIRKTPDGGFVFAGTTRSDDLDILENKGETDFWVVKLNPSGQAEWKHTYGSSAEDDCYSIAITADGGYICAGVNGANDGDASVCNGWADLWVIKLDAEGDIQWEKSYGGASTEIAYKVIQANDGGYIIAGSTSSSDGDIDDLKGSGSGWVLKIDYDGQLMWEETFGNEISSSFNDIIAVDDGYIAIGKQLKAQNAQSNDFFLVRMDNTGNKVWERTFGGSVTEEGLSVTAAEGGNFVACGSAASSDGDIEANNGLKDIWLLKINGAGEKIWSKTFGGPKNEAAYSIASNASGDLFFAGYSESPDGGYISNSKGSGDGVIGMVKKDGEILWFKKFGSTGYDSATDIQITPTGECFVSGVSNRSDNDVLPEIKGEYDAWVFGLDLSAGVKYENMFNFSIYPNPAKDKIGIVADLDRPVSAEVFNVNGQTIKSLNAVDSTTQIDIDDLSSGIYMIRLTDGNDVSTRRFVVD